MNILQTKIGYECPILKIEERLVKINGVEEVHYIVIRQPNVTVLALNNDGMLIFIKQKRGKNNSIKIELPSGKLDKYDITQEEAKAQALAELREETGFIPKNMQLLEKDEVVSSWFERDYYLYVAWDLEEVGQELEDSEDIEIVLVDPNTAREKIDMHDVIPQEALLIETGIEFFKSKDLI